MIELRKIAETNTTITLGWTPPANVGGYVFYAAGQAVSTGSPNMKGGGPRQEVKFSKTSPGPPFHVVAVVRSDAGAFSVDAGAWATSDPDPDPDPEPEPQPVGGLPAPSPEGIVMCGDATAGTIAADYAAIRDMGFKMVRKEVSSETRVLRAAEHGLMFLPLVYGQGDTFHSGSVQKVVDAVNRFARGGTFWRDNPQFPASLQPVWFEIGNEPYLSHEQMWPTVATWAQGWLASAKAAKQANPAVKVILPVGADINGPQGWRPWTDYVLDAAPEIASVMDAWSCHPYCAGKDPASYTSTGGGSSDFQRFNYIRQKLAERGVSKPWMISEFGYHTDSLSQGVTEAQQAEYMGRAYDIVAAANPKPLLFSFYTVKDYGDGSNQEHNFGFHFRRNGTIKPASATLKSKAT